MAILPVATCTVALADEPPIIPPLNYLAHLLLAENHAASRVGNLLGDFVPGRPESLRGSLPDAVLHGIVRHRAIDRFTDSHRITLDLKAFHEFFPDLRQWVSALGSEADALI